MDPSVLLWAVLLLAGLAVGDVEENKAASYRLRLVKAESIL